MAWRTPGTVASSRSSASPTRSTSSALRAKTLTPTGVRIPVLSMSMRLRIGWVQAFFHPGSWSASSMRAISSSRVDGVWSGHTRRSAEASGAGAQEEYQRGRGRRGHCSRGLSRITVSIIASGAGSVGVSALPALPWTLSTSGKARSAASCRWSCRFASSMEIPGSVVGM